jgi:endonuclease/exonuclease/phosphatase family metal-dependent hydrolase
MTTTLCTFNVNNLFARYKFGKAFPGDKSGKSKVEDPTRGYLPVYTAGMWELFNPAQRALAAQAIKRGTSEPPEILCLMEVESMLALRKFNEDAQLLNHGYKHALLIDSRDFRQIDVAVLSNRPILNIRTHIDDIDPDFPDKFIFSRDCLEVEFDLGSRKLTLFLNHLKSKMGETEQEKLDAAALRQRQARYVVDLVRARFPGAAFHEELFAVVGDLNDQPDSAALKPLTVDSGLVDALGRIGTKSEHWTEWYRGGNSVSQLDHMLISPALDSLTSGILPQIERRGIGFARTLQSGGYGPRKSHFEAVDGDPNPVEMDFQFPRFADVDEKNCASDHCPVFLEIP